MNSQQPGILDPLICSVQTLLANTKLTVDTYMDYLDFLADIFTFQCHMPYNSI